MLIRGNVDARSTCGTKYPRTPDQHYPRPGEWPLSLSEPMGFAQQYQRLTFSGKTPKAKPLSDPHGGRSSVINLHADTRWVWG